MQHLHIYTRIFIHTKSTREIWEMRSGLILSKGKTSTYTSNFLSLGWKTVLEGGWATSWPTPWRCGKELGILHYYYFSWKCLKERRGQVKTIVMEHFNGILFYKSGPANKQHTNQSSILILDTSNLQLHSILQYGPPKWYRNWKWVLVSPVSVE